MSDIKALTDIPFVMCDEGGEIYYAEGHIDRWRFVVAFLAQLHEDCGDVETSEYLGNKDRLVDLCSAVRWTWHRERFPGDELMPECAAEDDGAQPFTEAQT